MTTTADETLSDSELLAAEPGQMRVQKRNGTLEQVDLNKIVRANQRCAEGLDGVDPMMIAVRTIAGVHDGVTTSELDLLSIRTAAAHIVEEPNYSKFAARILSNVIDKEIRNQNIHAFSQSVVLGHQAGLVSDETAAFVEANKRKLNDAIDKSRDNLFEYFGLRTVYDRYLASPPRVSTRHRVASVLLHARGVRACYRPRRGDRALHTDVESRVPDFVAHPVQLRHASQPDVLVLPARLA